MNAAWLPIWLEGLENGGGEGQSRHLWQAVRPGKSHGRPSPEPTMREAGACDARAGTPVPVHGLPRDVLSTPPLSPGTASTTREWIRHHYCLCNIDPASSTLLY
jgi:hypothetical protein